MTTSGHYFSNYMNIFHKTEVQMVILRCWTGLKLTWYKSYDTKCKYFWNYSNDNNLGHPLELTDTASLLLFLLYISHVLYSIQDLRLRVHIYYLVTLFGNFGDFANFVHLATLLNFPSCGTRPTRRWTTAPSAAPWPPRWPKAIAASAPGDPAYTTLFQQVEMSTGWSNWI